MSRVVYNWLGSTGLKISNLCLGTMTFGENPGGRPFCDEVTSHAILDKFIELGGNFIDTADVYNGGKAEMIIGSWLNGRQDRDRFVIATKCGRMLDTSDPNGGGATRKNIVRGVDNSLKRLNTTYIDILYVHLYDYGTPLEETLSALNDLVHEGKVRYISYSNCKGWQLQKIIEICRQKNYPRIIALQQQYNLLCRSCEWEVTEVCQREGVAFLPWSPLKGGWLSGKLERGVDKPEEGTRIAWTSAAEGRAHHSHPDFKWFSSNEQAWSVIDKCQVIAQAKNASVPQVAIRWLLQQENVPSVIIGVRTMEQLLDNMAVNSFNLSDEEMAELTEVSSIPAPYPYDYISLNNRKDDRIRPNPV